MSAPAGPPPRPAPRISYSGGRVAMLVIGVIMIVAARRGARRAR